MGDLHKTLIKSRFSQASNTYNKYSSVHQNIAKDLVNLSTFPETSEYILEIGSGTGILTSLLHQKYNSNKIVCLDISEGMNKVLKKKFPDINCVTGDFEYLPFNFKFTGVFSSTALQWAQDETSIARNISSSLQKGGSFAIAVVMDKTFSEIHEIKKELFHLKTNINLPSFDKLTEELLKSGLEISLKYNRLYMERYNNVKDAFQAIKGLGIGGVNKRSLNPVELNVLKTSYQEYCEHNEGYTFLKYDIGYFTGEKST